MVEENNMDRGAMPHVFAPETPPLGGAPAKAPSNIYALLLIAAALFLVTAIYLTAYELNKVYGVTFGGLLSPPSATTVEEDVKE